VSIADEQQLFEQCVAAASDAEREQLLTLHPDAEVARRVRMLLGIHVDESRGLGEGSAAFARAAQRLGAFELLERIGEGAIGEVFLAEQQQPVRRRVALKILKFGLGTREVIARFELERQTLALMTHPNIARILDAGTTQDGRPWFAMEYVPGIAITRYCDQMRLDVEARLALFAEVCAGVQHAHLRGVIHRDLKPSNILVAEVDGRPLPKIIDFGIAKAATAVAEDSDARTRFGHVLGTPEYMSPEQAQLSPLEIDARTDVYSLGVLLYELLTGARPYDVTRDSFDPAVIARDIREGEVVRPSVRSGLQDSLAVTYATGRGCTPRQLSARLRGDLDWITLKALEKDRQRRYSSMAEFAADLERAATDQPVSAGPPSAFYLIGKFARRHRIGVAATLGIFVAALLFGSGMAVLAYQAAAQRDRANREAAVSQRVTEFIAGLFGGVDPAASGRPVSARELLDAGVERLESQFASEREDVQAALLEAAANAYRGLGDYTRAQPLIERAVALRGVSVGTAPVAHARAVQSQAALSRARGDLAQAENRLREALREFAGAGPAGAASLDDARLELAQVLRLRSQFDEAERIAAEMVQQYEAGTPVNAAGLANALATLGRIESDRGKLADAERHLQRGLELSRRAFGDQDLRTREAKDGLAGLLVTRDQSARAEPLLREIVEDTRRAYGPNHPEVSITLNNLGNAVSDLDGRREDAEAIYQESIALLRADPAAPRKELATSLSNLAALYLKMQRWEAARDASTEALALRVVALGPAHPETASAQLALALAHNKLGEFDKAEALLRSAVGTYGSSLGRQHWRTANAQTYLGMVLTNQKRYGEADAVLGEAHQSLLAAFGPEHYRTRAAANAIQELRAQRR
jgi:serine/threonine protein kinase/tetratricopeptide (TPR) repeat protein